MKMSEKGIILCFLISAVLALGNFPQVASQNPEKYKFFVEYEAMYQGFITENQTAIDDYMTKHAPLIDTQKSTLSTEIQEIFEEIWVEVLFPRDVLGIDNQSEIANVEYKEKVVKLFYMKYLVYRCAMWLCYVKTIFLAQDGFSIYNRVQYEHQLNLLEEILIVYLVNVDYKKFIPSIKDLYLQNQQENGEDVEEAKKLLDEVETFLKYTFGNAKKPDGSLLSGETSGGSSVDEREPLLEGGTLLQRIFEGMKNKVEEGATFLKRMFEGLIKPGMTAETYLQGMEKLNLIMRTLIPEFIEPGRILIVIPQNVEKLVNRITEFKLLVKNPDKESRIVKIIKVLMACEGWDILGDDDPFSGGPSNT